MEYIGKPNYEGFTVTGNITKRIYYSPDLNLNLLAGRIVANHESYAVYDYQDIMCTGFDFGLVAGIKSLALYAGYSSARKPFQSEYDSDGTTWVNFGIGFRF